MEAHMIFKNDSLSEDIIGSTGLWNTIIGEGDAMDSQGGHHPSGATLVRVIVVGPPDQTLPGAKVKLVVTGLEPRNGVLDAVMPHLDLNGMPSPARTAKVNGPGTGKGPRVMEAILTRFDSTGVQAVPFSLDGTGCEHISMTAQLIANHIRDSLQIAVPFECGE